ncbi:MAG: YqiJ family protein [Candidatus Accumulibacter sp.]|jgi:hypothetical protein|nr:YqiJ family protein [Accumulibacter sp.]
MSLFLSEQCLPFTASLIVMLVLTVIEGAALGFGGSDLSGFFSIDASPDADVSIDVEADTALDGTQQGASVLLAWFHVGRVPFLMLLILFLFAFGASGFVIQAFARRVSGDFLPAGLAACGAFLAAIPALRVCGSVLLKILPQDESQAVSLDSLVGRAGIVVLGTARVGVAAQARVRDEYGRFHYILVEPDDEKCSFGANTEILLVKRVGGMKFQAIKNPHAGLIGV